MDEMKIEIENETKNKNQIIVRLSSTCQWQIDLPATSNDFDANRSLAVRLLQSVIVSLLSSSPYRVYLSMNLNVMKVPKYSVSMVAIERHHQVIVAIPKFNEIKCELAMVNY